MTFLARSAPLRCDAGGSPKGESSRKFGSLNALHNLSLRWDLFFENRFLKKVGPSPKGNGWKWTQVPPSFLLRKDSTLKPFEFQWK